ncbi:MAG: DNA polymerase IV, partial [Pseudomonadota bacterium]
TARVAERLQRKALQGGLVRVKIRRADFTTQTRQRRISPPTDDASQLSVVAHALLSEWLAAQRHVSVRLLGMGAGDLRRTEQLDLF